MRIRIEGGELPGRDGAPPASRGRLGGVEVGVQRRTEVADRVPVHAGRRVAGPGTAQKCRRGGLESGA